MMAEGCQEDEWQGEPLSADTPPIVLTAENLREAEKAIELIRRYLRRRHLEGRPLGPDSDTALLLGDLLEAVHRYWLA